jgi:hypothetical protein
LKPLVLYHSPKAIEQVSLYVEKTHSFTSVRLEQKELDNVCAYVAGSKYVVTSKDGLAGSFGDTQVLVCKNGKVETFWTDRVGIVHLVTDLYREVSVALAKESLLEWWLSRNVQKPRWEQ